MILNISGIDDRQYAGDREPLRHIEAVILGHYPPVAVDSNRNQRNPELRGHVEGPLVETPDLSVRRPRAFREDRDAPSVVDVFLQAGFHGLVPIGL